MQGLNCTVYAYDPSITAPKIRSAKAKASLTLPPRGHSIHFSPLGVGALPSSSPSWPLVTLHHLLATNGHLGRRLDYLKVDIEGEELATLPEWLDSGVLDQVVQLFLLFFLFIVLLIFLLFQVQQLGLEFHLPTVHHQEPLHPLLNLLPCTWWPLTYYLHFRYLTPTPGLDTWPRMPQQHHQTTWRHLVTVLQRLYTLGFRVIGHDVNTAVKQAQDGYFSFMDVVFMRDNVWSHLDTK